MKCPNCSYEIENVNARKCPACGARITREAKEQIHEEEHGNDNNTEVTTTPQQEIPVQEAETDSLFCPTCGNRITEDTNYCPRCGCKTKPQFDDLPQQAEDTTPPQTASDPMPLYEQQEEPTYDSHDVDDNIRREDLDEYIDNGDYKPYENDIDTDGVRDNKTRDNEPQPYDSKPKADTAASNSWFVIACTAIASILIGALLYLIV